MKKLWLTYAWADNEDEDVDFVIQSLKDTGLEVSFDRAHLVPGQRLWPRIDDAITSPQKTDAWAIYATEHSLRSEPCLEELAYALDRTLRSRGNDFPIIGVFPEPIERRYIPSSIATRLYVSLDEKGWAEKVRDGVEGRPPQITPKELEPFIIKAEKKSGHVYLEIRPRLGRWYPFVFLVPEDQNHLLESVVFGPSGERPMAAGVNTMGKVKYRGFSGEKFGHQLDSRNSSYVHLNGIPDEIIFGDGKDQTFSGKKAAILALL